MTTNKNIHKFHIDAKFLYELGAIDNIDIFKDNISAFLLHMSHLKAYDYAKSFCGGKKVLEIGCNIGYGTIELSNAAEEIVGVDFDSCALQIAKKSYASSNIRYEEVKATNLPYERCSFDVVLSFQVIEHIKPAEVSIFLSEINRVLKNDGIALLTTPNRKLRLYPFQKPLNSEHYTEYSSKGFYKRSKSFFKNVHLLGLRAEEWIEEIEKNRIHNSLYRAYIWGPMKILFEVALPNRMVHRLKEIPIKSKLKPHKAKTDCLTQGDFKVLSSKFSMDSFWFEESNLDKSLYFLSICEKDVK